MTESGRKSAIPEGQGAGVWGTGVQPVGGPRPHKQPPGCGRRSSKLVIEIASNEDDVKKAQNRNVPYTVEEIAEDAIRCARAGAAIIHFHNKDPKTGENLFDDADVFLETANRIRKESDVIFCPSYRYNPRESVREQLAYLKEFAAEPGLKPEIMGVVLAHEGGLSTHYDPKRKEFYNPKMASCQFLDLLQELEIKPIICVYEIGQLREILALLDYGLLVEPLTIKLFFSDVGLYGVPPTPEGMTALNTLMDPRFDWQALVSVYGPYGSKSRNIINSLAISTGHHLRLGIGDMIRNGFYVIRDLEGEEKTITNVEIVQNAVSIANQFGRGIATPTEAREIFGIKPRT